MRCSSRAWGDHFECRETTVDERIERHDRLDIGGRWRPSQNHATRARVASTRDDKDARIEALVEKRDMVTHRGIDLIEPDDVVEHNEIEPLRHGCRDASGL